MVPLGFGLCHAFQEDIPALDLSELELQAPSCQMLPEPVSPWSMQSMFFQSVGSSCMASPVTGVDAYFRAEKYKYGVSDSSWCLTGLKQPWHLGLDPCS